MIGLLNFATEKILSDLGLLKIAENSSEIKHIKQWKLLKLYEKKNALNHTGLFLLKTYVMDIYVL